MASERSSATRSPLATVKPNRGYPFPWPHSREIKDTPMQCVKVYASSVPAQAADRITTRAAPVSQRRTGKSITESVDRRSEPPQARKVIPSIEHSPKKCLESGIEYSARKYVVGAGRLAEDLAVDTRTAARVLPSSRSSSISVHGLNPDMGKDRDDDWVPSSKDNMDPQPLPTSAISVSRLVSEQYNPILPTAVPGHEGTHLEIVDLETSPSSSSSPTSAMRHVKREHGDGHDLLRRASPPTWNSDLRCWILKQEGIVEIPKEVVEHEMTLQQLIAQRNVMQAKEREEKGKKQERSRRERAECSTVNEKKRIADDGDIPMGPRKTPRNAPKQTHDSRVYNLSTPSKTTLTIQSPEQVSALRTDEGLSHCNRVSMQTWRNGHTRRVTEYERFRMPKGCRKQCTCQLMPDYFTRATDFVPSLATWRGSELEFLEHVKQLSSCSGHPSSVRDACCRILEDAKYPDRLGPHLAISFAQNRSTLSTSMGLSRGPKLISDAKTTNPRAAPVGAPRYTSFYSSTPGVRARVQMNQGMLSAPNSLPLGPNARMSRVSSVSSVGSASSTLESRSATTASNRQTPPPSSPLRSARRDAGVGSDDKVYRGNPSDDSDGDHAQTLDTPAASPPINFPETPLSNQKERHRSMPAISSRRRHPRSPLLREETLHGAFERPSAKNRILDSANLLHEFNATLEQFKRIVETLTKTPNGQGNQVQSVECFPTPASPPPPRSPPPPPSPPPSPPPPITATITAAAAAIVAERGQPANRKSRTTTAQRQAGGEPKLDRNVPHHLRESDEVLLDIGKNPKRYQRHRLAPYAFSYVGRLYAEYIKLLTARDEEGNNVWDCQVIRRLRP